MHGSSKFNFGGFSGKGVNIAVVDSGIDGTHPYLEDAVKGGVAIGVDSKGNIYFDDDYTDVAGHGTGCAGLIKRIAPDSSLYSVKILDEDLESYTEVLVESIRWAVASNMNIINLSLGTSNEELKPMLQEACDFANKKNVLIVAAGERRRPRNYPAEFPNVFGVDETEIYGMYSYTARQGEQIEFFTGDQVKVPWLDHGYLFRWGASFAAAHFTGIVALILERHPSIGFDGVRKILIENAVYQ